ncbi:hypothetical protein HanRHA438_Chr16g0745511 [Helianthus annuus]|nr:hypothetical protein HanIR_Chr16g0797331 [Helianthus annuus]KAJ0834602.1 hypothetical protein HanRHA438_Chr16g0745511 [Helianthus annuus]
MDERRIWDYIRNDEGLLHSLHGDSSRKESMKINLRERGQAWAESFTNEEYRANPRVEELLYRSSANGQATRRMFKALSVGALVIDRIIDCWAEVLNYEEQFKAPGPNNRLFMGTRVVFEWMLVG